MIVVVDDWRSSFDIPADAADRFRAGPRWVVPAGVIIGCILALMDVEWLQLGVNDGWLLGAPVFLLCWVVIGLELGGPRVVTVAGAVAAAVWVPLAAAFLALAGLRMPWSLAGAAAVALGQVVAMERLRRQLAQDHDAVLTARIGTRQDGWVVGAAGPLWSRELRIEPSDGSDGPWTGTHAAWRAVRPGAGHPVGIWRGEPAGPRVVLLPRVPR